jgi:hypothetical protein
VRIQSRRCHWFCATESKKKTSQRTNLALHSDRLPQAVVEESLSYKIHTLTPKLHLLD